jgi:hypothetical protein
MGRVSVMNALGKAVILTKPPFEERYYKPLLFLIWIVISCVLLAVKWHQIAQWGMGDPDDQMRVVEVRDWLAGQSWWDITQYRMNPPNGGPMHWSRLVDVPIAGLIVLFNLFVERSIAERAAFVILPLLTLGIIMIVLADITKKLFDTKTALLVTASLLMITPVIIQLVPMRIDHHGWQLVAFLAASWALQKQERPVLTSFILGSSLALWTEISIEGLPFAALFMGVFALRWIMSKATNQPAQLNISLAVMATTMAVLFAATEGLGSPKNFCDALSPVHIIVLLVIALIVNCASVVAYKAGYILNIFTKICVLMVSGGAGIACLLIIAPQCGGDAFGNLDPLVRTFWFDRTSEGLPLWKLPASIYLPDLLYWAIGFTGLIYWYSENNRAELQGKIELTLLFCGTILIGMSVERTTVYSLLLAQIFISHMVIGLLIKATKHPALWTRMMMRVVALIVIFPGILGQYIIQGMNYAHPVRASIQDKNKTGFNELAFKCQSSHSILPLNALPPSRIMAGLDVSPLILMHTKHSVVATGHHRNQLAMKDVIKAFTLPPDLARQIFRDRKIEYLVTCRGSYELMLYDEKAPNGLWAKLKNGETPKWLIPQAMPGPYQLWRVLKP